jgi:cell division septal protein FtsQ
MSFFRRKARNRRLGHERVLDVKMRTGQGRASRLRMVALALGLIFTTILGFFLVWRSGQWALNRLIYENNAFAIQTIDVQTDGVMAVDQLRRWSGVKVGENLLALDLGRVKRDLEMVSLIRSVAVERILPHTLRLRVMEREPLAQAAIYPASGRTNATPQMNNFLQLDRDGFVISPVDPRQRAVPAETNEVLPLITGINPAELIPGRPVGMLQARAALDLIQAFDRSPMSGLVDLQRIDISSPGVLQVTTAQGSEITFLIVMTDQQARADEFDKEMRRWHAIFDQLQKKGKAIVTLDLSVPTNIPARWVEASTMPAPAPRNKNPQHNRKKNV